MSVPSYECCRLHAGPAAGPAAGPGVRCGREPPSFPFYRYTTAPTLLAATTTCLDARVAPGLCQGRHLSTAHAAHAAPTVVIRDACCFFFACQTQEHTARSKKGADLNPLAVARLPASHSSANSGEGALKRFLIRYRHRAEQEVVADSS